MAPTPEVVRKVLGEQGALEDQRLPRNWIYGMTLRQARGSLLQATLSPLSKIDIITPPLPGCWEGSYVNAGERALKVKGVL